VIALEILPQLEAEAKKRMLAASIRGRATRWNSAVAEEPQPEGRSRDEAAKLVGVGQRIISGAKAIQRDAPELIEPIRKGELTVGARLAHARSRIDNLDFRPTHWRTHGNGNLDFDVAWTNSGGALRVDVRQQRCSHKRHYSPYDKDL
jgi:hypothetical protein